MQGIEKMLQPLLGMLSIAVPDSSPENDTSKFMEELIVTYVPKELPRELIRKFVVDAVNNNEEATREGLRQLRDKIGVLLYGDK